MGGYLEALLLKIGLRRKGLIVIGENWMKKLGYFLFTINPNSKLDKKRNNMRYSIISKAYVYLEVVLI